jgi:hypothetical protein
MDVEIESLNIYDFNIEEHERQAASGENARTSERQNAKTAKTGKTALSHDESGFHIESAFKIWIGRQLVGAR